MVRETYGVAAYRNGDYRTATRELRTAIRITGIYDTLPILADAERGMGRPERALDVAASPEAESLNAELTIELMMVVAGAYADTGDMETALRTLEMPALRHKVNGRWQVRLWAAYADLLERAGRSDEALNWRTLAADADVDHLTDAAERLGRAVPQHRPVWEALESIDVLDAFDETADDEPAPGDAAHDTDGDEPDPVTGECPSIDVPDDPTETDVDDSTPSDGTASGTADSAESYRTEETDSDQVDDADTESADDPVTDLADGAERPEEEPR